MKVEPMRRREFITLLGGAAVTPSLLALHTAHAQQGKMPVIGFLHVGVPEGIPHLVSAFRQGLDQTGYAEGRNVVIEFRFAHNDNSQLPKLAADLVRRRVAVLYAGGSDLVALAAKQATSNIPVVFTTGGDPVETGIVQSLNRPGGNATGITSINLELEAKRLGLLSELLPGANHFAVLVNPSNVSAARRTANNLKSAASILGRQLDVETASTNAEIDAAFARLVQNKVAALVVSPDVLFSNRRLQIATLTIRHALPVIAWQRDFAATGGLMSYGMSVSEQFRLAGIYVGRILKGEKPADLPVLQPTKFEFVINLQTARTLGIDVPPTLLAIADEVIE